MPPKQEKKAKTSTGPTAKLPLATPTPSSSASKTPALTPMSSDDDALLTPNEKIMRSIQKLYTTEPFGLVPFTSSLKAEPVNSPSPTITVLILGNHSSGKSSFINWYIGEHVQTTGVAMETQGFDLVTCGLRSDTLLGDATLQLFPRLSPLRNMPGLVPYLRTKLCVSRQRKFPMVTFVDTPGLVDGLLDYPFDIDQAIAWFADLADLVLVFLDPIGQSLCKRTMDVVQNLQAHHGHKIRYYLTKADQCHHARDRDRVLIQITQNLAVHIRDKVFDLPAIYIPNEAESEGVPNAIEDVCKEIAHFVDTRVQAALVQLKEDTERCKKEAEERLAKDRAARSQNFRNIFRAFLFALLLAPIPLFALTCLAMALFSKGCEDFVPKQVSRFVCPAWYHLVAFAHSRAPFHTVAVMWGGAVLALLVTFLAIWLLGRRRKVLPRQEIARLRSFVGHVSSTLVPTHDDLFATYLAHAKDTSNSCLS